MTGTTPRVHGVVDGGMRNEGYPISLVSTNGFSSVAKKVPPIWYTLEENKKKVALISVPGSTPPELSLGLTLRGRWGGWGFDFPSIIFNSAQDASLRSLQGLDNRSFSSGPELTRFNLSVEPVGWKLRLPKSYAVPQEVVFENWGSRIYGYIYSSQKGLGGKNDRILFSFDKKNLICDLQVGDWSDWKDIDLFWKTKEENSSYSPKNINLENELSAAHFKTHFKIRVIKLGNTGSFRIRFLYDNLNPSLVKPSQFSDLIEKSIGPMTDFVDNYPPQLVYAEEDKQVFLEEAEMSLDWHKKIVGFLLGQTKNEIVIHDIYTPNQMLTSRWWLPFLDPKSDKYSTISEEKRQILWKEVLHLYQKIDEILGETIKQCNSNCLVVLSSDHGAIPLNQEVLLNNLFAKEGLLKFQINHETGEFQIDWKQTKVVFLQMNHIFISPTGFQKPFQRSSGSEFEALRKKVKKLLEDLKNNQGKQSFRAVLTRDEASQLDLADESLGDLILVNEPGFSPVETVTAAGDFFRGSVKGGYKQGVLAEDEKGMWTPFMIAGPGIKKGWPLKSPIRHIDQYPTIMRAIHQKIPSFVEGRSLDEVFEK